MHVAEWNTRFIAEPSCCLKAASFGAAVISQAVHVFNACAMPTVHKHAGVLHVWNWEVAIGISDHKRERSVKSLTAEVAVSQPAQGARAFPAKWPCRLIMCVSPRDGI